MALFNLQPQALFAFLEDFVYKGKFDGQIRSGLRHNQSVASRNYGGSTDDKNKKTAQDDGQEKNDAAMEERNQAKMVCF